MAELIVDALEVIDVEHDDAETLAMAFEAREFLVQKSRQNGNPVDVAKVKCRTAKFERLEKEANRRKSQPLGIVKSSWVEDGSEASVSSGRPTFVKTYVSNAAPKKSIHELP